MTSSPASKGTPFQPSDGMVDPPLYAASVQIWEAYLQDLKSLPNTWSLKKEMIADAEEEIEHKRLKGEK
jgi:hypothetical protein